LDKHRMFTPTKPWRLCNRTKYECDKLVCFFTFEVSTESKTNLKCLYHAFFGLDSLRYSECEIISRKSDIVPSLNIHLQNDSQ
jgi:hypothetical protein